MPRLPAIPHPIENSLMKSKKKIFKIFRVLTTINLNLLKFVSNLITVEARIKYTENWNRIEAR